MDLVGKIIPYLKGKRADYLQRKVLIKFGRILRIAASLRSCRNHKYQIFKSIGMIELEKKYQQNGINYFILLLENLKLNMNHLKYV